MRNLLRDVGRLKGVACGGSVLALLFFVLGYYAPAAIHETLHQGILHTVTWRPDSPPDVDARFRGQQAPGANPDTFRVWVWNITNVEAVRQGAKPHLAEVGPLTYYKSRIKVDAWWDRQGHVAVKEWDYHTFQPQLSAVSLESNITTLNLPLLGVLELLHASGPAYRALLDLLLGLVAKWSDPRVDGLFTTRTVGELTWGYEDPLLLRLASFLPPGYVPTTRVGLIRNYTYEEALALAPSVINTGLYDVRQLWNMEQEQGWSNVTSWGPGCTAPVTGTDAFQFRPGILPEDNLTIWLGELFRSATVLHTQDVELHAIKLFRFEPDPSESQPDPCKHQTIPGLLNVTVPMAVGPNGNASSPAAHGVPLYPSQPHLCQVDPTVSAALEGVACDPTLHSSYIDVEPITGITMRAAKRMQLNSQLTTESRQVLEPNINTSYILPIFWCEEVSEIAEAQAAAFRNNVYWALRLARHTKLGLWIAASATFAAVLLAVCALVVARRLQAGGGADYREGLLSGTGGDGGDGTGGDGMAEGLSALESGELGVSRLRRARLRSGQHGWSREGDMDSAAAAPFLAPDGAPTEEALPAPATGAAVGAGGAAASGQDAGTQDVRGVGVGNGGGMEAAGTLGQPDLDAAPAATAAAAAAAAPQDAAGGGPGSATGALQGPAWKHGRRPKAGG